MRHYAQCIMTRITISVPEDVSAKAEARAKAENRSVSSYVSLLMVEDLREHGLLPNDPGEDDAKFWATAQHLGKKNKLFKKKVADLLGKEARTQFSPR